MATAQLEPDHPGQIQIKHDQIGRETRPPHLFGLPLAERYVQPRLAGERGLSNERTVAFEVVAIALGYIVIVIDDENERLHIRLRLAGRKSPSSHEDAKQTE